MFEQLLETLDRSVLFHVVVPIAYAIVVIGTRIGVSFARSHDISASYIAILEGLSNQEVGRQNTLNDKGQT